MTGWIMVVAVLMSSGMGSNSLPVGLALGFNIWCLPPGGKGKDLSSVVFSLLGNNCRVSRLPRRKINKVIPQTFGFDRHKNCLAQSVSGRAPGFADMFAKEGLSRDAHHHRLVTLRRDESVDRTAIAAPQRRALPFGPA
jgi:hypothetical protein